MTLLSVVPGGGFSRNRWTRCLGVDLDDPERRRIGDRREVDRRFGAEPPVLGDEGGDVEVGDDVAVDRQERVVDSGALGGEADRSGGVERLGLDGVAQLDTSATTVGKRGAERIGEIAERQRHRGDAGAFEPAGQAGDDRLVTDRQHRLRHRVGQRAQPSAEATDEDDGVHRR